MSDGNPKCACHLIPTLRRLFGATSPVVQAAQLCATTTHSFVDDWAWEAHLVLEEVLLFPQLPAEVRERLAADHNKWRRLRRFGLQPDAAEYAAHAALESEWFATIK